MPELKTPVHTRTGLVGESHHSWRSYDNSAEVGRLVEEVITFTKQKHHPVRPDPRPELLSALDLRRQTRRQSGRVHTDTSTVRLVNTGTAGTPDTRYFSHRLL